MSRIGDSHAREERWPAHRPLPVMGVLFLAMITLFHLGPAAAQTARFSGSIEVTSVTIEVTVTRHGRPVTDLGREDFQIFEDGEERRITGFTRITGGLPTPDGVSDTSGTSPHASAEARLRPHVVLLFDVNGASLPVLSRAAAAASRWVEEHASEPTLWAVAAVGTEPQMVLPYTSDVQRVRDAIGTITTVPSARDLQRLDSAIVSDTIRYQPTSLQRDDLAGSSGAGRLSVEKLADLASWQEGKNQLARVGLLGRGLTEILRGSASIRGPKACLLFSGNIDLSPAFSDAYAASTSHTPFAHRRLGDTIELSRQLQELSQGIAQLSASTGFRIYPIAMRGLQSASSSIDVATGGSSDLRDETSGPTSLNPRSPSADWDALPLTLAEVTGGRYIRRNRIGSSLDEAYTTLSAYYILGFQSPRKTPGTWRKLNVKVRRSGVRVEYRHGRYDLDREQTLAEQLTAARVVAVDSGDFSVELQAVSHEANGSTTLTSTITTRLDNLAFLPNGETWIARLGLLAAAYDAKGRFLVLHRGRQTVKIPAALWENVKKKQARFALSFELPEGASQVTMALFDQGAETWGIANASIGQGEPQKPGLVNPVPGGVAIPVLRRLPSPALERPAEVPNSSQAHEGREEAASRTEAPGPLETWAKGPVRWLLTADERRTIAQERSEAEAARWIELFWARRDPNPKTAANPFKKAFEERVRLADALLVEPELRGSLTERGHVLVLLGRPKSRRKSAGLKVDTWFYRRKDLGDLASRITLPPVVRFQFRLDDGGHFVLHDEVSSKQHDAEEILRWYPSVTIVNPHLSVAPIPALFVGVPAASAKALERLSSSPEDWPAGAIATSYPEAFPGQSLRSWVVVDLPGSLPKPTGAIGLVLDREKTAVGSFQIGLNTTVRDTGWAFDLSLPVPDTRSTLMLAVLSGNEIIAVKTLVLRIPVVPPQATIIRPAILGTGLRKIGEFHPWTTNLFGGYHLDPRPGGRFHLGDTVYFFFTVVRPGRRPGSPPVVHVTLRLLRGGTARAKAHWDDTELSMMSPATYLFGSSFSLAAVEEPGQYTMELTVREPVSGTVQITSLPVTIEP